MKLTIIVNWNFPLIVTKRCRFKVLFECHNDKTDKWWHSFFRIVQIHYDQIARPFDHVNNTRAIGKLLPGIALSVARMGNYKW